MADNFTITPGVGKTIGSDEIASVHYQRIKLIYGADGVNSGDVADANPFPIKITDGTNIANVRSTGSNKSLNVAIVDGSGNQITSFGGGTQYTEDAASAADPVGGMLIVRRRDTLTASEVSADSDNIAANATSKGEIYVKHVDTIGVTGTFWQATQPVSGTVTANQGGTWNVRNQDGSGNALSSSTTTPAGTEQGLIVRNIPSGTQTVSGTVTANAGTGNFGANITQVGGVAITTGSGVVGTGVIRVAHATDVVVKIGDNSGSAVDGTTGVPTSSNRGIITRSFLFSNVDGGYTPNKLISAATTNATSIKASAGTLGFLTASNTNVSPRYLKFYNKASAPTVGTDTPVQTFMIPGDSSGTNIPIPTYGLAFSTGIAFAITANPADNDTTAIAANEVIVNYGTK